MISLTKHNELKGYKSLEAYPEVAHFVTTRHEGIAPELTALSTVRLIPTTHA